MAIDLIILLICFFIMNCSSLMAAVTCFVGLHFGQIIAHFKVWQLPRLLNFETKITSSSWNTLYLIFTVHFLQDHMQRMSWWSMSAFPLLVSGYVLQTLGMVCFCISWFLTMEMLCFLFLLVIWSSPMPLRSSVFMILVECISFV